MRDAFCLGVRDLGGIWELILAPDTLGEVLVLETAAASAFRFPDDLWGADRLRVRAGSSLRRRLPRAPAALAGAALPRPHRRLRPGDTRATAEPTERALEEAALAFERQKPYLVNTGANHAAARKTGFPSGRNPARPAPTRKTAGRGAICRPPPICAAPW